VKVYFISGLGADERIFQNIHLPPGNEAVYLSWLTPLPKESLRSYAVRLGESIDTKEEFGLVGLSFGGMLATEIAAVKKPAFLILISSIASPANLPAYYRTAGRLGMHKIIPVSVLKSASFIKRFFTPETAEEKKLIWQMIRQSDPKFIRWALEAILNWKNENPPQNIIHIHGSKDELLPLKYTHPTHVIEKAGHLMVLRRAKEINRILHEVLPHQPEAVNT